MAYREFHNEKYYAAPDISILTEGLDKTAENIGALFRSIGEQQTAKRKAADQYKFDLGEGKFENDDKIFFQRGLNITQRGKNDIKMYGRISPQLEQDQNAAIVDKKQSDWQFKKFEQNEKEIATREQEDKYFDPQPDRDANRLAAYGENNDIYYSTRGERLEAYEKVKGKLPQSLRGKFYTSDYVKAFGKKEKTKTVGDPTYQSTTFDSTPFLTPQGTPGVTVDHAKEYLGSRPDGSVARWVENLVDADMDADVSYNKARNPALKGMSDAEAKLYLKANPKENLLNKKDFSTRVIEKAQQELAEAADINRKTDYETKVDKSLTQGLYKNDAIGHSYTEHTDRGSEEGKSGLGYKGEFGGTLKSTANYMPGGNLRIGKGAKIGSAIPLEVNPEYTYNIRTGKTQLNVGSTALNLTGYQLQPYTVDGKPYTVNANSPEELIQEINKIPYSEFKKLDPNMRIAMRGYTVEQGNKLGEIASRRSQLDDQLATAIASGDTESQNSISQQIMRLEDLRMKMNLSKGEFSDEDMMSAFKQNGIPVNSIKRDVLMRASQSDLDLINRNVTQGLDLNDKSKWSPDMRAVDEAYQRRAQQAQAAGYKSSDDQQKRPAAKTKEAKQRTITFGGSDYEVPSGRIAVKKPDGNIVTIPESQRKLAESKGYIIIE